MASYLVTGIAGFIGSAVGKALIANGHEVVGIDNLSSGCVENIHKDILFINAPCHTASIYEKQVPNKKYDAILHLAGQNSGELSFADPVYDLQANTESTLNLLQFARKVDCKRFIFASSKAVYGDQPNEPVKEDASLCPTSCYGVSKLASEHYLRIFEKFGISYTALRLFSVYGAGQSNSRRPGMVSTFMDMLIREGHIHIKGNPNRFRDFVYIDDVVQAFMQCLARPQSGGKVINIGGSGRVHVGDLVERLCAIANKPITVEYSGQTVGDTFGVFADISRAAKYLGYDPNFSINKGLELMYKWYQEQVLCSPK